MIFEFRFYTVTSGRMRDILARFEHRLPTLMLRHGINQVGRWSATSGSQGPCFVYAMAYTDLTERERQWNSFYMDDDWWTVRAETNAGEEMVERFDLLLARESPLWPTVVTNTEVSPSSVQELTIGEIALGKGAPANKFLRDTYLPAIKQLGGRVMCVADLIAGTALPKALWMVEWPNAEVQSQAQISMGTNAIIADAFSTQRKELGRTALGRLDQWTLVPTSFALPDACFGRLTKED